MFLSETKFRRYFSLILLTLTLLPCLIFAAASEDGNIPEPISNDVEIKEMICRIKNAGSGLYLDSYKYTLKTAGKAYVENYSKTSEGQVFHLSPCDDGTFMIIPQNDSAEYVYSYSKDAAKDNKIKKTKLTAAGELSKFDIIEYENGRFAIAPSNSSDQKLVLIQSGSTSEYSDPYVELADFDPSDLKHLWIIEPIETEKLTVIFTKTKVRLYSSGKFYARKLPYNSFTHDIVWSSDNEDVILMGKDGSWCALSEGEAKITASSDGATASFIVSVVDRDGFTWYSQNNVYTSDWDATQLLSLYFRDPYDGVKRKFAVDAKEPGGNSCWMDQGCGNASVAMVLNNMGARKTSGYDFRSGQTGNLIADPYTVGLANSGSFGADTASTTLRGNPIYMRWAYVAEQFNVDGKTVKLSKVYSPSTTKIKNILAEHPEGVIVQLSTATKNHYIVFTKCINPEEKTSSKLKFMVCDSAAYLPQNGDNVLFEESTSYIYEGYRYRNIASVMYFVTEE